MSKEHSQDEIVSDEKIAFRLVELYFSEITHLGLKRKLDIDHILNAYFYTLQRLKNKDQELTAIAKQVMESDKKISLDRREELFPTLKRE